MSSPNFIKHAVNVAFAAISSLMILPSSGYAAKSVTYKVEQLASPEGYDCVHYLSINDQGDILAACNIKNPPPDMVFISRLFLYTGASAIDLSIDTSPFWDVCDAYSESGRALNNAKQVAIYCSNLHDGFSTVVRWEQGKITNLGEGYSVSINSRGDIVGAFFPTKSYDEPHAAVWDKDNTLIPQASVSRGTGINNRGSAIGYSINYTGIPGKPDVVGRQQSADGITALPGLKRFPDSHGKSASEPWAINDSDIIVGVTYNKDYLSIATRWINGEPMRLPVPKGYSVTGSAANAINKHGIIVGYASSSTLQRQALIWKDRTVHVISELLDAVSIAEGWKVDQILSINAKGEMLGFGSKGTAWEGRPIKLTPVQ